MKYLMVGLGLCACILCFASGIAYAKGAEGALTVDGVPFRFDAYIDAVVSENGVEFIELSLFLSDVRQENEPQAMLTTDAAMEAVREANGFWRAEEALLDAPEGADVSRTIYAVLPEYMAQKTPEMDRFAITPVWSFYVETVIEGAEGGRMFRMPFCVHAVTGERVL